ncbi:MAG: AAA family ATPase [Acidobacteria bacterium]|nr:AAA family ATPase [Acidobacteriota bacterium]
MSQERRPKSYGQIIRSITGRYPLTYVLSWEEDRVEKTLREIAASLPNQNFRYISWTVTAGLVEDGNLIADVTDPIAVLDTILQTQEPAIFALKDFHPYLKQRADVVRKLRDVYFALKNKPRFVFLLSAQLVLPVELKKEIEVVDFELPSYQEIEGLFDSVLRSFEKRGGAIEVAEEEKRKFVMALQGLTINEATHALTKLLSGRKVIDAGLAAILHEEKRQITLKEGILEYVPHVIGMDDIGGLENLKEWLARRSDALSDEARAYGLAAPRGVLVMGVTGCGKSLCVKAIANLWNLPLFRLDMNNLYAGLAGPPEEVFQRALKIMDSVSPAILWIDEIESGISDKTGEGAASRVLGYFLTWMQEHESRVFVAATANRIDLLPAEVLRRGRFDQIFFIDLPSPDEREQIFMVHLRKTKESEPISKFHLSQLAKATKAWSGAEIEQAVTSAMYDAFAEKRPMIVDDLYRSISRMVPLATTMSEQIKKLRSWAHDRAIKASQPLAVPE